MAAGVHGGTGFAGFGSGAGGFLGVELVGEELGLGEDFGRLGRVDRGLGFVGFVGCVGHFLLSFREAGWGFLVEEVAEGACKIMMNSVDLTENRQNIDLARARIATCNKSKYFMGDV